MYPVGVNEFVVMVFLIWIVILSFFTFRQSQYLKKLFPQSGTGNFKDKLEEILLALEATKRQEEIVNRNVRDLTKQGLNYIQKVEIVRYNPYQDMGGEMSFSAVLLDGKGDGVLLTSLHSRSGSRIYAKAINKSKSELKLSKEEEQILEKALNG